MLRPRPASSGLTIIELMVVLVCVAVLTALALPSFGAQMRQARRADAFTTLAQIQQAQERYRSGHASYASSLDQLIITSRSPLGYYQVATQTTADTASNTYSASAEAIGSQAADTDCKYLRVRVQGGVISHASGPSDAVSNDAQANRNCWRH